MAPSRSKALAATAAFTSLHVTNIDAGTVEAPSVGPGRGTGRGPSRCFRPAPLTT